MYKIKLVQENPKVGDIQGNLDLAKSHITEAKEKDLDLIIFSEMFLTGYPPEDLLLREDFLEGRQTLANPIVAVDNKKKSFKKEVLLFKKLLASANYKESHKTFSRS